MTLQEFCQAFEQKYASAYLLNDPAHREDHFKEVLENAIMGYTVITGEAISERVARMYAAAAYLHDLFAWSRYNHHILSAVHVRSADCKLLSGFTLEEREQIALMCEQHRASFTGKFGMEFTVSASVSAFHAELFNAADLGKPDLTRDVARAYKYAKAHAPTLGHDQWLQTTRPTNKENLIH